nr:hypothetical protein BgiMline_003026 [Biomphalaria glabrata]
MNAGAKEKHTKTTRQQHLVLMTSDVLYKRVEEQKKTKERLNGKEFQGPASAALDAVLNGLDDVYQLHNLFIMT